jgi:hypothetical protein
LNWRKRWGSSFFSLAQQFAANCKKSRMYCQTAKDEKKSVDLGFSKVGLLSFSQTSLNKAKSALCLPHTHPKQQLLDVVFLLSTDSFTAVEFYQVFVLKSCNRV